MKKCLLFTLIILVVVLYSCKGNVTTNSKGNTHEPDSAEEAMHRDSIEREKIFAEKGDTIFGKMQYGMNKKDAIKVAKDFVASLSKGQGSGFYFGTFWFFPIEYFYEIENMPASDLKYSSHDNRLYQDKLYSVEWESFANYGKSGNDIAERIDRLVKIFEIKYGRCSEVNYNLCRDFGRYVSGQRVYVQGCVAEWNTQKRTITVSIKELFGSDRRSESTNEPLQYKIYIKFVDKTIEKEAEEYIERIIKADGSAKRSKEKEDSIKMINAL